MHGNLTGTQPKPHQGWISARAIINLLKEYKARVRQRKSLLCKPSAKTDRDQIDEKNVIMFTLNQPFQKGGGGEPPYTSTFPVSV